MGSALSVHLRLATRELARRSLTAFGRPDLFGRGFDPFDDRSNVVGIHARAARKTSPPPPVLDGSGLSLTWYPDEHLRCERVSATLDKTGQPATQKTLQLGDRAQADKAPTWLRWAVRLTLRLGPVLRHSRADYRAISHSDSEIMT
jgi:hypothetical protein